MPSGPDEEVDHVAVLHDVAFAFDAKFAGLLDGRFGAGGGAASGVAA